MTDFALSFQKENKSLFQHEDSLTIKGTWESIQMQEELRKSFWASTRAMKDWLPTSRSLHKPGRHQQLTSAVWSEEQPSSGPAALPRRTLTPARPIGTDREACGAGKWDIRTGSCMRVHSSHAWVLSRVMPTIKWLDIYREAMIEARAAERKQEPTLAGREEQGDVLAQRATGSSEWIYFLPLERDLSVSSHLLGAVLKFYQESSSTAKRVTAQTHSNSKGLRGSREATFHCLQNLNRM